MNASHNINTQRMSGARRADFAIERIDQFFETEAQLSEEDKIRAGSQWGVEHGFLTADEALELERLGHVALLRPGEIGAVPAEPTQ